ncbi:MAG: hypothetical protein HZC41_25365 [Chloroflexi bacterium]|nr:hypothetical protein [Chloroflexota bacterium]
MSQSRKLKLDEPIPVLGGLTVGDFWSWAYSDVLSNANRSVFAEFLVGATLGVLDSPRIEWNGFDLEYRSKKIEVKTSAYLQSWPQKRLSTITFDICPKRAWDASTAQSINEPQRIADCYVFCLYAETNFNDSNVLNVERWEFYVVSTGRINQSFGSQKSISLSSLKKIASTIRYSQLRSAIDEALGI